MPERWCRPQAQALRIAIPPIVCLEALTCQKSNAGHATDPLGSPLSAFQ
jgi:hypothetical protein